MTHAIIEADVVRYLRGNRWLVQNGALLNGVTNGGNGVVFNVRFPNFNQTQPKPRKVFALGGVSGSGSFLRGAQVALTVKARVGVPVRAVDLNNRVQFGKVKVHASNEATAIAANSVLVDCGNAKFSEDVGDGVLDRGYAGNLAGSDCLGSRGAKFGLRRVGVVRGSVPAPCFPTTQRAGGPIVIADGVWLGNDALCQSEPTPFVVALAGTVFGSVLRFVLRGRTGERLTANSTLHDRGAGLAFGAQRIRTLTAASRLPTVLKALLIRFVLLTANGACHLNHVAPCHNASLRDILPDCAAMGKVWDDARKAWEKAKREPIILPAPVVVEDKPAQLALFEEVAS